MFTEAKVRALQIELDAVLKQFAEKHNLVAGRSNAKYSSSDFKIQVSFSDQESNPTGVDPRYLRDLEMRGHLHGLDKSMVGKTFNTGRGIRTFQGMRATKAVASDTAGTIFLYDARLIAPLLAKP